ncbi:hypothetical protein JF546_02390 [Nitratireductor aquimarinus]|uniref:hypothetical protein n=1 Tax=Nitratireductor aquimarinus TaxID=889300 RepID=UPI001A8F5997|nr:hypothetical protein [Nitratireductor aquimarinus]MBN8241857.1 hypothetical protein [Nitratireductor aquimarinus]MBY6130243.1 hypothetical protein [Nitratireductor aquimarinus]MCA1305128.1 hypothetical protein [Nitratireductor aquimarinus]
MLKLSRSKLHREKALDLIDRYYAARIDAVLGPMAALHILKRIVPAGELVADREAIVQRATEQDAELAAIDRERRDLKAAVRAAASSNEIKALIAHL